MANGTPTPAPLAILNQIPWMPIITLIGWLGFALSFYFTTKASLENHQQQIAAILTSREKLIGDYTASQKDMANGIAQLNQLVALRSQEGKAATDALTDWLRRMEAREDKIVQLLDTLYQSQQETSRVIDRIQMEQQKRQ
jgi:ABC-type transporter Mla subunit MlaD